MARKCTLTGKRPNVANNVSHSHRKSKRRQLPNLQFRRLWWEEGSTYVRIWRLTSYNAMIQQLRRTKPSGAFLELELPAIESSYAKVIRRS